MLIGAGPNRSERKKIEILTAARGVFLKQGYPDTGMELVARLAGVSTATLYAHFPSKAKLFELVVHEALENMAEPVRDTLRLQGDARFRLTAFALAYARFMTRPATRAMFRMVTVERRRFEALADIFVSGSRQALEGAAIQMIADLSVEGQLQVDQPLWAAGQLLGMLDQSTLMLGLTAGDEALPARPIEDFCADAVKTFLARYGT